MTKELELLRALVAQSPFYSPDDFYTVCLFCDGHTADTKGYHNTNCNWVKSKNHVEGLERKAESTPRGEDLSDGRKFKILTALKHGMQRPDPAIFNGIVDRKAIDSA